MYTVLRWFSNQLETVTQMSISVQVQIHRLSGIAECFTMNFRERHFMGKGGCKVLDIFFTFDIAW